MLADEVPVRRAARTADERGTHRVQLDDLDLDHVPASDLWDVPVHVLLRGVVPRTYVKLEMRGQGVLQSGDDRSEHAGLRARGTDGATVH